MKTLLIVFTINIVLNLARVILLGPFECGTLCVCNQSPGCVILPNHEVVEFQPQSGITTVLDFVAYFYVVIPRLP